MKRTTHAMFRAFACMHRDWRDGEKCHNIVFFYTFVCANLCFDNVEF